MRRIYIAFFISATCFIAYAGSAEPLAGPARPKAPTTAPAVDGWVGEYSRIGGSRRHEDEPRHVSIVKTGDVYHLRGTGYDNYEFVEEKPGLLWDRAHIIGTINRGKLTFEAAGRLGEQPPRTVLNVEFCYEFFFLFATPGGQPPATAPSVTK